MKGNALNMFLVIFYILHSKIFYLYGTFLSNPFDYVSKQIKLVIAQHESQYFKKRIYFILIQ